MNGRTDSRLYARWFRPPGLYLFLEESGRDSVPFEAEGKLLAIEEGTGSPALTVRTPVSSCGILRVRLSGESVPEALKIGGTVRVRGKVSLFEAATNPGEFDFRAYYESTGCFLQMTEADAEEIKDPALSFADAAYRLRCFLHRGITAGLDTEDAAFLDSFLLGLHSEGYGELKDEFSAVSMLRILLQSGFHLTLFASLLDKILGKLNHRPLLKACLILFPCFFYTAFSGFSLSFVRGLIVLSVRLLAPLFRRKFDLLSGASFSLCLLLVCCPGCLFSLSVQYYLAVLFSFGVLVPLAREYFRGMKAREGGVLRIPALLITTVPVQICHNYTSSLYAPLVNALVLPLTGLILLTGFAGAVFLGFGSTAVGSLFQTALLKAGTGFSGTAHYALQFYRRIGKLLDKLPGANRMNGMPSVPRLLIFAALILLPCVILWLLLRKRKHTPEEEEKIPGKRSRILFLLSLFALFAAEVFFLKTPRLRPDEVRLVMLDVGQGQCILLSAGQEHYLIDCGSSSDPGAGKDVLIPALEYYGIGKLDAVILSHGDEDHVNFTADILSDPRIRTERVLLSDIGSAEEEYAAVYGWLSENITAEKIHRGMRFGADSAEFTCLHPAEGEDSVGNDASSVLLFDSCGFRILFPGDISAETEETLLPVGKTDLLIAAHHGSDYSSSQEFLGDIRPETVLISCGRNNVYGHPGRETMARLKEAHSEVYVTAETGAVCVRVKNGELTEIRCFAVEKRHGLW